MNLFKNIYKKLGVPEIEQGAVSTSWLARFFFQIGFVVAWTIITALFVEQFGIANLPWLFLIEAILYILGSVGASFFLEKISMRFFLLITNLSTLVLLLSALLLNLSPVVFFGLILSAKSLVFSQVNIALYRRTETLFSTSQAQKTMPIIESAITIGAVVGAALTLVMLDILPGNETQFVLTIWGISLIGIALVTWFSPKLLHFIPHPQKKAQEKIEKSVKNPLDEAFLALKNTRFIKHISLLLVLQMAVFTIIEIEFTKEVQSHITHTPYDAVSVSGHDLQASILDVAKEKASDISHHIKETGEAVSSKLIMHESLAHDLGMFHLIFAILALFFQLLLTPYILAKLGIVRSIISYFGVLSLSVCGVILGYIPVSLLRIIQHSTHSVGESAYHISYYSIFEHNREAVRLFLEGIMKPIGIGLSVFIIFSIPHHWLFYTILSILILMLVIGIRMRLSFTKLSQQNLRAHQNIEAKVSSVEVLGQSGHKDPASILTTELKRKEEHPVIREKIIHTLSDINDPKIVHQYLHILRDPQEDLDLKNKILESLFSLHIPESYWKKHAFTRYHLLNTLKHSFDIHDHPYTRKRIIMNIFKHLPHHEIAPFFLENIQKVDDKLKSIYLRSCKMFEDPEIVFYVRDYIKHTNPMIQSHAIIALWKFEDQENLRNILYSLAEKSDEESKKSAFYALGEIKDEKSKELLFAHKDHKSKEVRLHTAIALAKLGDERAFPLLINLLFGKDMNISKSCFRMLHRVSEDIRSQIQREIQFQVSQTVSKILTQHIEDMNQNQSIPQKTREILYHLYWLAGRYDDLLALEKIK